MPLCVKRVISVLQKFYGICNIAAYLALSLQHNILELLLTCGTYVELS